MTAAQLDLWADDRTLAARLRGHAWRRCLHLTNIAMDAKGDVDRALATEALATARLAYDIADGLLDEIEDTTGLAFCGYLRDTGGVL